jgi:very-short-patch-repair endonuclease
MKYSEIKETTRKLRSNPTKSEERLWHYLRRKQLKGKQFFRQYPIVYDSINNEYFYYIPDFYCFSNKLAIELDGKIHLKQIERDQIRDERLQSLGITVLRFKNEELYEIEKVLNRIKEFLV